MTTDDRYPPIADYAFLGDGIGAVLVSTTGAIDWACLQRIDAGSMFGRLLDWDHGGVCRVGPTGPAEVTRRYVGDTMILETTFRTATGAARLLDFLALHPDGTPEGHLVRIVEGLDGEVELAIEVVARFDYGSLRPAVRALDGGAFAVLGGDDGLLVWSDVALEVVDGFDLRGRCTVRPGERHHLSLDDRPPHALDPVAGSLPDAGALDRRMDSTIEGWEQIREDVDVSDELRRSALVLRALGNADTGAIAAAATTSLPEVPGGSSNWDYRYTWIRDSWLTVRALAELGDVDCADRFRRFVERSAAGQVDELHIAFGVGGEHDLFERELDHLEGWRGHRPVRVGNAAADQLQLDAYGALLELAWLWHRRGEDPEPAWWDFLVDVVDRAAERWREPDHGIWEVRGERRHFVHSKAFAWVALDRGVRLAADLGRGNGRAERWQAEADACRAEILERGVDGAGCLRDAYDSDRLDAALLLLPTIELLPWDDPVMVTTVDAVLDRLVVGGLVRRREDWDDEGAFIPCTFWLVECLAHQGRTAEAEAFYERAMATANDVGVFPEEWDTAAGEALGNVPQALSHLGHISAALALGRR